MKIIMIAGFAALSLVAMPGQAGAQPMSPPARTLDPNAAQPAGAVPAETGMVPASADVPHDPAAPVGTASNPVMVGGNMTPPPTGAKAYPVCGRGVRDDCVNPGEVRRLTHRPG